MSNSTEKANLQAAKSADILKQAEPVRKLSRKAQEMKAFIERNPIPKEFLKQ